MEELNKLKDYATENSVPIMFDEGIEFIVNYIKNNDVSFILEIGTAIGYSAIKFAQIHPEIRIFTIEYDIDRYQQSVKNVNKFNLGDQITVFLGDALKFNFTERSHWLMQAVTKEAISMTKTTAPPIPRAVRIFLETPRNGQIPRILDRTILLTRIAPTVRRSHSFPSISKTLHKRLIRPDIPDTLYEYSIVKILFQVKRLFF